ncbi:MAG: hypothetical protein GC185_01205 [Alphaproteobacteria bacterium]|nr:hypothetical protein [Alphaproteobacteria bacterium]
MKPLFGILGVVLVMGSMVPYARAMWHKTVKPHAFSWFLWGMINTVVCAAQVVSHGGAGAWTSAAAGFFNFTIAVYALKHGEKNITRSDWVIFLSALCALPLWVVTKDPLWSVVLLSVTDMMGFFPTIRKSWHEPHGEVLTTFAVGALGFIFAILALDDMSFVNYCYPATVLTLNVVFTVILLTRRRALLLAKPV